MRLFNWSGISLVIGIVNALNCNPAIFQGSLGFGTSLTFVKQLTNNSTFKVPTSDIAYPTSPTNLPALCALQVKVSSNTTNSSYSFGLFLPDNWNGRFL
jgi:feruloyl esterase